MVEGATPRFLALVRHRRGVSGPPFGPPLTPPLGGVAPSTLIPAGRPPGALSRSWWMSVRTCGFVTCLLRYVLWCFLCCTVFHFISASLPKPVNGSSSSAPSGTSTSAPGCAPSSMRPSKNSRPQLAQRPRRASLEHAHNPIPPIRSTGSLPPRSTVPEDESLGSNDCMTCPPTSRMVQWIPVQLEGYNKGMEAG